MPNRSRTALNPVPRSVGLTIFPASSLAFDPGAGLVAADFPMAPLTLSRPVP
jgi:hypothetical protein